MIIGVGGILALCFEISLVDTVLALTLGLSSFFFFLPLFSEFEDTFQDRQRAPSGFSSHGYRRNEYGSSPPARGDPNNYNRGIHGRWDNRSSARSDKDTDSQCSQDSGTDQRQPIYCSFILLRARMWCMFANILTIDGYTRGKYFKLCLFKNNLFPTFLRKFLIIIINYCFKKRGGYSFYLCLLYAWRTCWVVVWILLSVLIFFRDAFLEFKINWQDSAEFSYSRNNHWNCVSEHWIVNADSGKRYVNPSRRGWHAPEHDGLLGSGSFHRPSGYAPGASGPKFRPNDNYLLSRTTEPYHPPRPYKVDQVTLYEYIFFCNFHLLNKALFFFC